MPSSHSGRIVYARPPAKRVAPPRNVPAPAAGKKPADSQMSAVAALAAFAKLIDRWGIPQSRAWRMLTGLPDAAGLLTEEQAARVNALVTIDAGMAAIGGQPVGTWMATGNPSPLLGGMSPIDYLTRRGTPGYAALLRQVERWATL